ncbi:MAG: cupin domain-containing protein [Vicinamibacterales bacterium]|nr:cupin domain-containing protein [Vicinamibacterales bacterium]MDP7473290.1 cupin domain-containing protein [Vicinamibacterales bacterium]MDP7691029.1 cupin domain-containing protein [Vicinamibacterales bacterium]HJO37305.1 cupin domain-containing protein [Vicinamibacterales bacterium]
MVKALLRFPLLAALPMLLPAVAAAQEGGRSTTATDVTKAEIDTVLASPDGGVDRQVKVVDIGHGNVAVGILHRGPTPADGTITGIIHHRVTEVYYVTSGGGTLTTGGSLVDPTPRAPDSLSVQVLGGPSDAGEGRGGRSRQVSVGDVIVIPAGVFHGWSAIEDHVTYLSVRPDPQGLLPAGYVNPAIR